MGLGIGLGMGLGMGFEMGTKMETYSQVFKSFDAIPLYRLYCRAANGDGLLGSYGQTLHWIVDTLLVTGGLGL